MRILASMCVLSLRWRPPTLSSNEYEELTALAELFPKNQFDSRMDHLRQFVRKSCPSSHMDCYIFVFAICCIICSAMFSLIARSTDISMWYPLILLFIPAALSFWMSRRRSMLVHRIRHFERTLKQTLEEFTKTDATHHIRWTFRRPTQDDPLPPSFKSARLCLVVEIVELDPEMALLDELPSYQVAISSTPNVATLPPSYSEVTMRQHLPSFQCPMRPEPVMVRATSPPCNTALS